MRASCRMTPAEVSGGYLYVRTGVCFSPRRGERRTARTAGDESLDAPGSPESTSKAVEEDYENTPLLDMPDLS